VKVLLSAVLAMSVLLALEKKALEHRNLSLQLE
jgi:hypothetical protein